jgi:PAS domain S-box-containing protein
MSERKRPKNDGGPPLRVLFVEDSVRDLQLIVASLERSGYRLVSERVDSPQSFEEHLSKADHEIIISDYNLRNWTAVDALEIVKKSGKDIPFLVVSGSLGDEAAAEIIKQGATDYILKDRMARLPFAIEQALEEKSLREQRKRAEEALRSSEEKYRLLFESNPKPMWVSDRETRAFLAVNEAAVRHYGYSREEFLAMTTEDIRPPEDLPMFLEKLSGISEGRDVSGDWRHRKKDGTVINVRVNLHLVMFEGKQALLALADDITERVRAENQVRMQLEHLAALRTIDIAISSSLDLRVSLSVFLDQVTAQQGVHAANILLLRPQTQMLEYAAGRGFRSGVDFRSHIHLGEDPAGRAVLERRIISIPNLQAARTKLEDASNFENEGFVSYVAAPLIAKGQVNGVLELWHREPLLPAPEWLEFLEALTGQAAIAIDNALLYQQYQASNAEILLAYDVTLEGWVKALDMRDNETEGHTRRVTEMTIRLAYAFPVDQEQVVHIRRGAMLHDIGKMAIPDAILQKPGPLTPQELEIMRRHTAYAYEWLSPIPFLRPATEIPYCHHERWDGTGYPRGLKGEAIPLAARLFSVVDVWDALRSDRPYRRSWPAENVRRYLRERAGKDFDPAVVDIFLKTVADGAVEPNELVEK